MRTVFATFTDPRMAENAAGALLDHGVKAEHLSIIFPEGFRAKPYDDEHYDQEHAEGVAKSGITTTTMEDAESGALVGATVGLATGAAAGLASLLIPGVGLILGGGALAIALGGMVGSTAAGALAGGVVGYLKDQGVSQETSENFEKVLRGGGAMVSVNLTNESIDTLSVENVLRKYTGNVTTSAPLGTTAAVEMEPIRDPVDDRTRL